MSDRESFYKKLEMKLEETVTFPSDYLYKFIVPSDGHQVQEVSDIFKKTGAVITTKKSKKGKYTAVSVCLEIESATAVIFYYKKASKIEGILSL